MSNKTRGRFYFKRTVNKNLIGDFSNHEGDKVYTEGAEFRPADDNYLKENVDDLFSGKYHSTWQEKGKALLAHLEIKRKSPISRLFSLSWNWPKGEAAFSGEGMLVDDMLIGDFLR